MPRKLVAFSQRITAAAVETSPARRNTAPLRFAAAK